MNELGKRNVVKTVELRAGDVQVGDVLVVPAPDSAQGYSEYEIVAVKRYEDRGTDKVAWTVRGKYGEVKGDAHKPVFETVTIRVLDHGTEVQHNKGDG